MSQLGLFPSDWKGNTMLKRFEVMHFKGFEDNLVFDLSAKDYDFNKSLIKNGIIRVCFQNKSIA